MRDHFEMMANYNIWANNTLYAEIGKLTQEELSRDVGAFFKSALGTLNHILVGDIAWLYRVDGKGSVPEALNSVLHDNFEGLWTARQEMDQRILNVIQTLPAARFEEMLSYKTMGGEEQRTHMRHVLTHLFNHQTHHRGQCHQCLTQLGKAAPSIDLIYYLRSLDV